MTPEEARRVLMVYGICLIHGIALQSHDSPDFYKRAKYCPRCDQETRQQAQERIAEAKKVLGLE